MLHRGNLLIETVFIRQYHDHGRQCKTKICGLSDFAIVDKNGNQLINWIADLPIAHGTGTDRDWNRKSDKRKILSFLQGLEIQLLDIPSLIEVPGHL
jgi:hypothetical protein